MRLLSFDNGAGVRPGVLVDDQHAMDIRIAAERCGGPVFRSLQQLIEAGPGGLSDVESLLRNPVDEAIVPVSGITLTAPLPVPQQLRDFANYEEHCLAAMEASMRLRVADEDDPEAAYQALKASGAYALPSAWYDVPLYYKGNRFATNGHEGTVDWPPFADHLDYELELACVIGQKTKDVPPARAGDSIFGYTIFNDFSARDVQARWEGQFRMGPAKGKDFDTSNSFGPWIVTKDEIDDAYALDMSVRVNGETRGGGTSGGAQHDFEHCIAHVSRSETIYPGEIFGLGTIPTGCGFETLTWLEPGDVVELEVEHIGVLRNTVRKN